MFAVSNNLWSKLGKAVTTEEAGGACTLAPADLKDLTLLHINKLELVSRRRLWGIILKTRRG